MADKANVQGAQQFFNGGGSAAARLLANGFDVGVLRSNNLLRKDEWKALDEAVVRVARRQLGAVEDLRNAGLTRNLGSLGVLLDEYEKVTEMTEAEQSMTGVAPGEKDLPAYELASVPIPITFKDFQVNIRMLEASRTRGASVDTVAAELAARKVAEKLETMVFNGSTIKIAGSQVYGYTDHPHRITGTLAGTGWTDATNGDPVGDTIAMIAAAEAQNYFGPFFMYIPVDYNAELRKDYDSTTPGKTLRQRILEIDAISGIRATSTLTDEVVLVQFSSDVVDLSVGQDVVTIEWDSMGGLIQDFKVMAAMAPRVKSSTENTTGVVHYTV